MKIDELRPGSVEMDVTVAIQTNKPDLDKLLAALRGSLHPKYHIQELKPIGGILTLIRRIRIMHPIMFRCMADTCLLTLAC